MQQLYPFSDSTTESNENFRRTSIYRLPQFSEITAPTQTNRITTRQLMFHLFLLTLTVITTTLAVGFLWLDGLAEGAVYSFTVLSILGAHEMGHYIACRWYGVEATLPYFIPVPLPPVGTFGAFIKMKSPIMTKRALFDIGIAGPIAGYVFAIPAAFIGHYFAQPVPAGFESGGFTINDPLLFKFFAHVMHLPQLTMLNPVLWAAWVGVFMTSLNLLPVGQLDGGHVAYAVFGQRGHKLIGTLSYAGVIALAIYTVFNGGTWNWVIYAALLTFMIKFGHPPVMDEREPLGLARVLVAIIGVLIFVLSFIPVPFSF